MHRVRATYERKPAAERCRRPAGLCRRLPAATEEFEPMTGAGAAEIGYLHGVYLVDRGG